MADDVERKDTIGSTPSGFFRPGSNAPKPRTVRVQSISVPRANMQPVIWTKSSALQQLDSARLLSQGSGALPSLPGHRNSIVSVAQLNGPIGSMPPTLPKALSSFSTTSISGPPTQMLSSSGQIAPLGLLGSLPTVDEQNKSEKGSSRAPSLMVIAKSGSHLALTSSNPSRRASVSIMQPTPHNLQSSSKQRADERFSVSDSAHIGEHALLKFKQALRGPIILELTMQNILFLAVIFAAWVFRWVPSIRLYLALNYCLQFFFCILVSKIIYAKYPNTVAPLYVCLIPFGAVTILAREVHNMITMLWFVTSMLILPQTGNSWLKFHVPIYTICFLTIHYLSVATARAYYVTGCEFQLCDVELTQPFSFITELVITLECIFLAGICYFLQFFITQNASALIEREEVMQLLYIANMDLQRQLRTAKVNAQVDLEAPLSRATQLLGDLKDNYELDNGFREEIVFIIELLSSDKLFQPDLFQKAGDADVHDWLKNMLLTDQDDQIQGPASNDEKQADSSGQASDRVEDIFIVPDMDTNIAAICSQSHRYDFDVFELEVASNGHALYHLGLFLFHKQGFFTKLPVSETKLKSFLQKVESGYRRSNPYHNSTHAADVLHAISYLVTRPKLMTALRTEEILASFLAASIHDYMHPGVNNSFLIATANPLALRYNDQSVLEHFHCASFFDILAQEDCNVLSGFSNEDKKTVRETVISMVLATDMAQHFDWIGKFKTKMSSSGLHLDQKADKKLALNMAMKCADVNNPSKPLMACRRWTQLVMEEFFRQGDEEKLRSIPISPFMNREGADIPKSQIGFIEFIVQPMFEAFHLFLKEDVDPHIQNILSNKAFWKECVENPSQYQPVPPANITYIPLSSSLNGGFAENRQSGVNLTRSPSQKRPASARSMIDVDDIRRRFSTENMLSPDYQPPVPQEKSNDDGEVQKLTRALSKTRRPASATPSAK